MTITKLKAFAIHLGISLLIFAIILYFILYHWYPFPFFSTDGGWKGIQIIAFVDIVLGPVLTLIVFKPGKKYLKFDMSVIVLLQTSALAWGIWVVHHERPAAAVFVEDYFISVTTYDLEHKLKPDEWARLGDRLPVIVYLNIPQTELQNQRRRALQSQTPMALFSEYYTPLNEETIAAIVAESLDMEKLVADNPMEKIRYHRFIESHRDRLPELAFLEWRMRRKHGIVVANRKTLEFIEFLDITPPPVEKKKVRY